MTLLSKEEYTMTITTMMEAGIRRGVGEGEVGGAGAGVVEEEAGEEEVVRISTKEDSLNSFSNMVGSITTKLDLTKADIILVEDAPCRC